MVCSPNTGSATILIGAGEYHETINVTRTGPLTLLASRRRPHELCTVLIHLLQGQLPPTAPVSRPQFPLGSPPSPTSNLVHIFDTKFVQTPMDDAESAVLIVAPSFNASLIGAGPTGAPLQPLKGNSDFRAYNIDWANRAVRDTLVLISESNWQICGAGKFCNISGACYGYLIC